MTIQTPFGQHIGQAAIATRAVINGVLAAAGSDFEEWLPLRQLATNGGSLPRAEAVATLSAGLDLREQRADLLLQRVQARGLIEDDGALVRLTAAGQAFYDSLLDQVTTASAPLYHDLDQADLDATQRVLTEVSRRARAAVTRRR